MSTISLSSGVRQALFSLQSTSALALDEQLKLSTGKKVNSAFDNPSSYFTSQSLNSRASDLGTLLDNIGQSVKTVEAANNGITSLETLIANAKSVASQALSNASTTSKVAGTTTLTGGTLLSALGFAATDTITVKAGSTAAAAFTTAAGKTVQDLINFVNADTSVTGKFRASLNDGGNLVLETVDNSAAGVSFTSATSAPASIGKLLGTPANATAAAETVAAGVYTNAYAAAAGTGNATRASLAAQYNSLLTQIDQTAKDASYNGVNLLNGDNVRVQFNEQNTSSITISGVTFSAGGLAIGASLNTFQSDADIKTSVNQLIAASTTLRTQSATFGSNLAVVKNRQDFTKATINTLSTGADDLVLADQNEEAAKLTTLNTRQQLASTSLQLANQQNQAVLRLFQ